MHEVLTLTRLNFRLKRGYLLGWMLPILALIAIFPVAYYEYYPELASRQGVIQGLENNVGTRAIYGLIDTPGTVGQMTTWEAAMWAGLLGSIMVALLMVDLYRRPEHTGLSELTRSTGIKASTQWAAATITGVIAAIVLGAMATLILLVLPLPSDELPSDGAISFGLTITLMLIGALLYAQLALLLVNDASKLTQTALISVAVSFVIRVVADTQEITWLNWLSPLGWRELIGPFTENDIGHAAILGAVCVVSIGVIGFSESRRAFAEGFLPTRRQSHRSRSVHGLLHLRWLLNKGGILAWAIVVALTTAFLMSLSGDIATIIGGDEAGGQVFRDVLGGTGAYQAFISYICQMVAIMIVAAGISQITSYHTEEKARIVDVQRSTGVRRYAPLAAATSIAMASVLGLIAVMHASGALGLATQEQTLDDDYSTLAWASWSLLGAVVVLVGIAVAIVGWIPQASGWAWAPLALSAVVTLMGEILQLPDWMVDLSPLTHALEPGSSQWWIPVAMATAGVVFAIFGLTGAAKRDIQ